jgi:hypothetical protein
LATPVFACEHAMHFPVHAFSQQNPSTQEPSWHSLGALHAAPWDFLPVQAPPEQKLPVRQCESLAQEVRQAFEDAQTRLLAQDVTVPGTQAPALQAPCGTKTVSVGCDCALVQVVQLACPQAVVGQAHCPSAAPVQLPLQSTVLPAQLPCPVCGAPVTGWHRPVSQDSQGPVQARSQQCPSGEQSNPAAQDAEL